LNFGGTQPASKKDPAVPDPDTYRYKPGTLKRLPSKPLTPRMSKRIRMNDGQAMALNEKPILNDPKVNKPVQKAT